MQPSEQLVGFIVFMGAVFAIMLLAFRKEN